MDYYLGEIRAFAMPFAPRGWALCNGALLQIQQYQALYSLLGTNYGGDGVKTFALPDLQGRTPVGWDKTTRQQTSYSLGAKFGVETVPLTTAQIPAHNHNFNTKNAVGSAAEPGDILSGQAAIMPFVPGSTAGGVKPLHPGSVAAFGPGTPHSNMQPGLVINFCIATSGNFPPRP